MQFFKTILLSVMGFLLLLPQFASAESTSCTAATCSTSARVNFQVVIPVFLRLGVGTTGATVDRVDFAPTAAQVGNSVAISGSDALSGILPTFVLTNGGNVTLSTALTNSASGLISGTNFIVWGEIDTADGGTMTAPTLQNGGVANVVYTATAGVVDLSDNWTYTYANTTVPAAGTYTGTATYTAAIP